MAVECKGYVFLTGGTQGPGRVAHLSIRPPAGPARTVILFGAKFVTFHVGDTLVCTMGSLKLRCASSERVEGKDLVFHGDLHATPGFGQRRQITADVRTSDMLLAEENRRSPPRGAARLPEGVDARPFSDAGTGAPVAAQYSSR